MCFVENKGSFGKVLRKTIELSNEEERLTRSNCKSGDELLSRAKTKVTVG